MVKKDASSAPAEPVDTRFQITLENRQIILTVPPPAHGVGLVTADEIIAYLQHRRFRHFNEALIRTLADVPTGVPTAVGEYDPRPATAAVIVSHDEMQAWIELQPPEPGGRALILEDLRTALRSERVVYGVIEEKLAALARSPVYGQKILVAEGKPVEHGRNGEIEYQFETVKHVRPELNEETGRVDFKELNLIENVVEDQLLAVKIAPTPGTAGITVRNEYLPPTPGKPVNMYVGKNVKMNADGTEARATCKGLPLLMGGRIVVSQVYAVTGSVGPATGNINFLGTVQISEYVEDGYTVKAEEDIYVGKAVGKARLEAGNDIVIIGGIMGKNEAKITCGGSLQVRFIQEAVIEAKHDVIVGEAVLHSRVDSGARVIVGLGGKKGVIVGGQVRAYKLVSCKHLGSNLSAKTLVDVGANPKLIERCEELQSAIIRERRNFDDVRKGIAALSMLREKTGGLTPEKEQILHTLEVAQRSLKVRLQELAVELNQLQNELAVDVKAAVSVAEEMYPGTRVTIRSVPYYVTQPEKFVLLKEEGGQIVIGTYEPPKIEKSKKKRRRRGCSDAFRCCGLRRAGG